MAELSRVASSDTKEEWLEFARTHRVAEIQAEIKDARKKNRKHPRKSGNGLPGLPVRLSFEFSPEEHVIIEKGLEKIAAEMSEGLDGAKPELKQVLVYLMDRMLHSEPGGDTCAGRQDRVDSPYTVVFHSCADCHRRAVETPEGRVEISKEALERFAAGAKCIDIAPEKEVPPDPSETRARVVPPEERDRANTPATRRDLCARACGRCDNPLCRRETTEEHGHGHHIEFRSEGGATALWNEVWRCRRCHACIHAGVLVVEGDPVGALTWTPRAADITRRVREEPQTTRSLPEVRVVETPEFSGCPETDSVNADTGSEEIEDATAGLVGLGWTRAQATERVRRAWARLSLAEDPVDVGKLLSAALRS